MSDALSDAPMRSPFASALADRYRIIYMQGAADRPIPYLRVVPHWVEQMTRAVDAADRSRAQ